MSPARRRGAAAEDAAPVFTALGDATRLHLVGRLSREGPLSISALTEGTRISRQAVTKHLRVLADAGIARGTREGRERIWRIEAARLERVRAYLDAISERWDQALVRLQERVEADAPLRRPDRRS